MKNMPKGIPRADDVDTERAEEAVDVEGAEVKPVRPIVSSRGGAQCFDVQWRPVFCCAVTGGGVSWRER